MLLNSSKMKSHQISTPVIGNDLQIIENSVITPQKGMKSADKKFQKIASNQKKRRILSSEERLKPIEEIKVNHRRLKKKQKTNRSNGQDKETQKSSNLLG